jgi:uncharacterized protein YjiS (DUF1127 family)
MVVAFMRVARKRSKSGNISDRELTDIGIARDEIDYIASQRSIDPRSG